LTSLRCVAAWRGHRRLLPHDDVLFFARLADIEGSAGTGALLLVTRRVNPERSTRKSTGPPVLFIAWFLVVRAWRRPHWPQTCPLLYSAGAWSSRE
jgi:hypothetical protein